MNMALSSGSFLSRLSASPRSRRPLLGALLLVAPLVGVLAGQPRSAEACSPAEPRIDPVAPAANAVAIPTNARIWLAGYGMKDVKLTAGTTTIATELTLPVPGLVYVAARPLTPLAPNTRYTVTAVSDEVEEPRVYSFTTGAGDDLRVPAAPAQLTVTAERVKEEFSNSCVQAFDGYRVQIAAPAVEGAAFYQLEKLENGRFVPVSFSQTPAHADALPKLPTPTYRVRPISLTGAMAADAGLPEERATEAENESGGCSAAPQGGGASLLWLVLGAFGWSLRRRARR